MTRKKKINNAILLVEYLVALIGPFTGAMKLMLMKNGLMGILSGLRAKPGK